MQHNDSTGNGQAATVGVELAARFRAIADHLEQHPTLAPVIAHEDALQIRGYHQWIVKAAVLLEWADSIHADHLEVRPIDGYSYVDARGLLVGGYPVRVWTTVDGFAEYLHTSSPTEVELSQLRNFIAEEGDR